MFPAIGTCTLKISCPSLSLYPIILSKFVTYRLSPAITIPLYTANPGAVTNGLTTPCELIAFMSAPPTFDTKYLCLGASYTTLSGALYCPYTSTTKNILTKINNRVFILLLLLIFDLKFVFIFQKSLIKTTHLSLINQRKFTLFLIF